MLTNLEGENVEDGFRASQRVQKWLNYTVLLRPMRKMWRKCGVLTFVCSQMAFGSQVLPQKKERRLVQDLLLLNGLQEVQSGFDFLLRVGGFHGGAGDGDVLPLRRHVVRGGDHADVDICGMNVVATGQDLSHL